MNDSPSTILSINSGSSSLKLSLFDSSCNRIFDAHLKEKKQLHIASISESKTLEWTQTMDKGECLPSIFHQLTTHFGFNPLTVKAIGHRFVHGGNRFNATTLLNRENIQSLEQLSALAPLHNDACLAGIKSCVKLFSPSVPQCAVFDTTFHASMPETAAGYALPKTLVAKYGIKRFGFHGISHESLWEIYQEKVGGKGKIITLHLGNGCSMSAIKDGRSLDTSMGFTPAEGLIMGTRAGDIDAALMEFLCLRERKSPSQIMELLNFHSGLLGISGISSNMQELLTTPEGTLAVEMFCYRILKYLGSYLAVLGGADAIVFSGGIGENSPEIREKIAASLEWQHVLIDFNANRRVIQIKPGDCQKISSGKSYIPLYVIGSDENRLIANKTASMLK